MWNKSVLFKWSISFILILIIPLMTWFYLYYKIEDIFEENTVKHTNVLVNSGVKNIENVASDIHLSAIQIAEDSYIKQFMETHEGLAVKEWFDTRYISQKISQNQLLYPVIKEIYIYFPKSDMCVYTSGAMNSKDFYEVFYNGNAEDWQEWKADLLKNTQYRQKRETLTINENKGNYISFIQTLPFASKQIKAVCVSSVRESDIAHEFVDSNESQIDKTRILITNSDNEYLLGDREVLQSLTDDESFSNRKTINGEKHYMLQFHVSPTSWNIYAAVPEKYAFKVLKDIRIGSIILFIIYFMISGIVSILLIRYNYAPVKMLRDKAVENLDSFSKNRRNEYEVIEHAFNTINRQKTEVENLIEDNMRVTQHGFLQLLLHGAVTQAEWDRACKSGAFTLKSSRYLVFLCNLENSQKVFENDTDLNERERESIGNFIIDNIMSELLNRNLETVSVESSEGMAYIVGVESGSKALSEIEKCFYETQSVIEKHFGLTMTATVSTVHNSYTGISDAFAEAQEASVYRLVNVDGAFTRYDKLQRVASDQYYYPAEKERILIKCVENGNYDAAKSIINEILKINFEQNHLSISMAKCLIFNIANALIRTSNELFISDNGEAKINTEGMAELLSCDNVSKMQETIFAMLKRVCEFAESKQNKITVIDYIEKNYSDTQMTVGSIAGDIGLHPTYLSNAFKENTGIRLQEYITKYRIKQAEILLNESQCTVEHIANMVGYDSVHSFIRNFKKYTGITPTQYRKLNN